MSIHGRKSLPLALPVAVLCWLALSLAPAPAYATELRLIYHLTHTEISHGQSGVGPVEVQQHGADLTVGLGDHYVYELGSNAPAGVNFTRRLLWTLDDSLHTYVESPLVALAEYRDKELSSRVPLLAAVLSVKPKNMNFGTLLDSESELGMLYPDRKKSDPRPTLEATPGGLLARFGGDTATVCTFSDTALTGAQESIYARYLLYFCKLHPDVRTAVLAKHKLPRRLWFRWNLLGTVTTVELELKSMTTTADTSLQLPAGYTRQLAVDSSLAATLGAVGDSIARCRSAAADVYGMLAAGKRAVEQGRALDAILGITELKLATCGEAPSFDSHTQDLIRKDARCKKYGEVLEKINKHKLADARATLDALDRTGLQKAYLIDLEEATLDEMQGNSRAAVRKFQGALRINPCLIGAWTDMGMVYILNYDCVDGWICVSIARRAAPEACPMLKQLDDRERELMAKHPEYFE